MKPSRPIHAGAAVYLKGAGLVRRATVDPKTNMIVLPPEARKRYRSTSNWLPDGPYQGLNHSAIGWPEDAPPTSAEEINTPLPDVEGRFRCRGTPAVSGCPGWRELYNPFHEFRALKANCKL